MKSTFSVLFYLKRNGQKSNGNMPIMGRITVNGLAVQFAAKVEIKPEYWSVQAGKAVGRNKVEVQEVNSLLESIKATMIGISRSTVCYQKYEITRKRLASFLKDECLPEGDCRPLRNC